MKLNNLSPLDSYTAEFQAAYKLRYKTTLAYSIQVAYKHKAVVDHQFKLKTPIQKLTKMVNALEHIEI